MLDGGKVTLLPTRSGV